MTETPDSTGAGMEDNHSAAWGICYQLLEAGIGVVVLLFCNEQGHCTRGAMERVAEHYHFPVYDIGKRLIDRMEEGSLT